MCFGLLVIIIGFIFLLQNLNIMPAFAWNILWPVLVIAIGFCMLFRKRGHRHMCGDFKEKMQEKFEEKK